MFEEQSWYLNMSAKNSFDAGQGQAMNDVTAYGTLCQLGICELMSALSYVILVVWCVLALIKSNNISTNGICIDGHMCLIE
jgi:hypothetical protein